MQEDLDSDDGDRKPAARPSVTSTEHDDVAVATRSAESLLLLSSSRSSSATGSAVAQASQSKSQKLEELDAIASTIHKKNSPADEKQRMMERIYSRRKRAREQMKIASLESQRQRFWHENSVMREENARLEALHNAALALVASMKHTDPAAASVDQEETVGVAAFARDHIVLHEVAGLSNDVLTRIQATALQELSSRNRLAELGSMFGRAELRSIFGRAEVGSIFGNHLPAPASQDQGLALPGSILSLSQLIEGPNWFQAQRRLLLPTMPLPPTTIQPGMAEAVGNLTVAQFVKLVTELRATQPALAEALKLFILEQLNQP